MSRRSILSLIDRYAERFPDEAATAARIHDFVAANPDCFERSLREGHVTGSAWVLSPTGDAALLTHHRKLDIWVQLGGHADGDTDIARVAQREAREESGIDDLELLSTEIFDIDIHEIPARGDEPAHLHYDCRFLLRAGTTDYAVTEESHDLAWIGLDEMQGYTDEASVMRMVRKSREQPRGGWLRSREGVS